MHLRLPLRAAGVAAAAGLLASGCGSSNDAASTGAPAASSPATATAAIPPQLLGTYVRTVSQADIDRTDGIRNEGPGQEAPAPGPARLVVGRTNITFVVLGTTPPFSIEEDYSAGTKGQLVIDGYTNPDVGSFCGPEIPQNATYTWTVTGGGVELKAVTDRCADRDSSLTGTWQRAS